MNRTCNTCKITKTACDFRSGESNGYFYILKTCIECMRVPEQHRFIQYRVEHGDEIRRRERLDKQIRRDEDPAYREKLRARSREYYRKNREKILAQKRLRDRRVPDASADVESKPCAS